jgi:hypothetical protein
MQKIAQWKKYLCTYVILNTYLLAFSLINFVAIHLNIKVMLFYFLFIKNIFFLYVYRSKNKGLWIPQQFFAVFVSGLRIHMLQVLWRTINLGRKISDISKKSMQPAIYCHYD